MCFDHDLSDLRGESGRNEFIEHFDLFTLDIDFHKTDGLGNTLYKFYNIHHFHFDGMIFVDVPLLGEKRCGNGPLGRIRVIFGMKVNAFAASMIGDSLLNAVDMFMTEKFFSEFFESLRVRLESEYFNTGLRHALSNFPDIGSQINSNFARS